MSIRYQYGFSTDKSHIHEEWLLAYPKGYSQTWFERSLKPNFDDPNTFQYDWYLGPNLKGETNSFPILRRGFINWSLT